MTALSDPILPVLAAGALGAVLGLAFAWSVRLNARLYLAREGSLLGPILLHAARWIVLAVVLYLLSRAGAAPLIAATAAFTLAAAGAVYAAVRAR